MAFDDLKCDCFCSKGTFLDSLPVLVLFIAGFASLLPLVVSVEGVDLFLTEGLVFEGVCLITMTPFLLAFNVRGFPLLKIKASNLMPHSSADYIKYCTVIYASNARKSPRITINSINLIYKPVIFYSGRSPVMILAT